LSRLEGRDLAKVLARKAEGDARVVRKLAPDPDIVSIYAVPMRYADLLDAEPLDRKATVALVKQVGEWADSQLSVP